MFEVTADVDTRRGDYIYVQVIISLWDSNLDDTRRTRAIYMQRTPCTADSESHLRNWIIPADFGNKSLESDQILYSSIVVAHHVACFRSFFACCENGWRQK